MTRLHVESSAIVSVGYSESASALEVEFTGGAVYVYRGVPAETHREFLNAESKGAFFNVVIRPNFPFVRA